MEERQPMRTKMPSEPLNVAVVGGGVAGIAAAYALQNGIDPAERYWQARKEG